MMEFLSNLWDLVMSIWDLIMFFLENPIALISLIFILVFFIRFTKRYGRMSDLDKD